MSKIALATSSGVENQVASTFSDGEYSPGYPLNPLIPWCSPFRHPRLREVAKGYCSPVRQPLKGWRVESTSQDEGLGTWSGQVGGDHEGACEATPTEETSVVIFVLQVPTPGSATHLLTLYVLGQMAPPQHEVIDVRSKLLEPAKEREC